MGSSSKPKSSRKRSSKIHSRPRKMKKVKKSRRSKSKKVTRRHDTSSDDSMSSQSISSASNDSYSLYSDSDSMSSVSFSSSSSEGTYRGRKKVSCVRSNLKSKRRRVRRRTSSSESSEDFTSKKKRKRSKKNTDSKSRKKSRKYKSQRDMKNSSATSDSHSCSICKEEIGSFSEESGVQKHRMKSRESKTHKRESREERVETKKRTHRSPSYSSYSRSRDPSYSASRGEETFIDDGKSRRLRSVITFAEQAQNEGSKLEKDLLEEEIIYERDDYRSPRSNDFSHGRSNRDVTSHSLVTSGNKRQKENVEVEETCVSNHGVNETIESRKNTNGQNGHDPFLNECETNKYEKESGMYGSPPGSNLGADDLEAILRQKALENLRKFRGVTQRNVKGTASQKDNDDGDAGQSSSSKAEIINRVLPKQDNTNVIDHVQRSTRTILVGEVSWTNKDIDDGGNSGLESGNAKEKADPPDGLVLSGNILKEDHTTNPAIPVSESRSPFTGRKASGMNSSLNQATVLQAFPKSKVAEKMESERKISPRITGSITASITNNSEADVNNGSSSATAEVASGEQSTSRGEGSTEQQTEPKDGSQFEQKTMSVMRGGEMVQVSYKVYIPKRAPALARRQLKR